MNSLTLVIAALILAYSLTSGQNSCLDTANKCASEAVPGDTKEILCSKLRSALDCAKKVAGNAALCSGEALTELKTVIDQSYKIFKQAECSGAGTLMTSLLLCLGLSGVAYFLTALK